MDKVRQFIKDYTRGCSNELCAVEDRYGKKVISYHEWLTPEQALAAVEIAREELIKKATSYIQQHWIWNTKMIEDFKKYMEK